MHFQLLLYFRKKEREKARESALQDLTKLGNLGALTGLEIVEGEEEDEADVFEESYDKTDLEDIRRNSTTIRLETEQNALIKSTFMIIFISNYNDFPKYNTNCVLLKIILTLPIDNLCII